MKGVGGRIVWRNGGRWEGSYLTGGSGGWPIAHLAEALALLVRSRLDHKRNHINTVRP